MRLLRPSGTSGIERISPTKWRCDSADSAFIFDVSRQTEGFIGFFVTGDPRVLAPRLYFDDGGGFSELSALSLKPFRRGFYHVPLARTKKVDRLRFRPCAGAATFGFIAVSTKNAALVAILHYLFNLRYQHIPLVAEQSGPAQSLLARLQHNARRIAGFFEQIARGGGLWVQTSDTGHMDALKVRLTMLAGLLRASGHATAKPLMSFVAPTFNTRTDHLDDLLESFALQADGLAELILSDDGSTNAATLGRLRRAEAQTGVKVVYDGINRGIANATNAGIAVAAGAWVAFIDHDDQFAPGAIDIIADAIARHPDATFFYTDEFVTDRTLVPIGVFCKPAYDSVLLSGMNYINHFSIFRRDILDSVGGLRPDREGSQDYDLLLRYLASAKRGDTVHVPFPAYLWRRDEGTYSQTNLQTATAHARDAIEAAYATPARNVEVREALDRNLHRVVFPDADAPLVSVIVPNKDSLALISRVVDDVRHTTDYPRIEIVIVDNGSDDPDVLALYQRLKDSVPSIQIDIDPAPFNFAAMCNRGAALARGDLLLFLNNDIEVREPDWLTEMVSCLNFSDTGIVGAKLLYPDGSIQHNGVIVGLGDAAGHWYIGEPADTPGPMGRFHVRQTLSAVTGACMLVTRRCFDALGGFDATAFPIAYNDVDFCLRARAAGFRTVWTPFACLTHHESISRGSDETGANAIRFKGEFARLQARHGTATYVDDAYSPLYDRRHSLPHLAIPETLPPPRPNRFR